MNFNTIFKIVILSFSLLAMLGCDSNAQSIENMIVFEQGAMDYWPTICYEITFYQDGLIKSLKYYHIREIDNPNEWDSTLNKVSLKEEYRTERNGKQISQYKLFQTGEKELIYSFTKIDEKNYKLYDPVDCEYEETLFMKSINEIQYFYNKQLIYEIHFKDDQITRESQFENGLKSKSKFKNNELLSFSYSQNGTQWEAKIEYKGKNRYIIKKPRLEDPVVYYDIILDVILPKLIFSKEAMYLNQYLIYPMKGDESLYLMPLVTRRSIP